MLFKTLVGVQAPVAQAITTEWMAEKCLDERVQSKQMTKHKLATNRKYTQTLAAQAAKCSSSSNGSNAKDNAIKKRPDIQLANLARI